MTRHSLSLDSSFEQKTRYRSRTRKGMDEGLPPAALSKGFKGRTRISAFSTSSDPSDGGGTPPVNFYHISESFVGLASAWPMPNGPREFSRYRAWLSSPLRIFPESRTFPSQNSLLQDTFLSSFRRCLEICDFFRIFMELSKRYCFHMLWRKKCLTEVKIHIWKI